MAIRSFPFNSITGDRKYNATHWVEYFASLVGNGVFPNPSDGLQVISNNDMTVTVKAGRAWINGYFLINDSNYILSVSPADGILDRKDRIVARWDALDREIRIEVKKGELSSSPIAPTLQRNADAYELGIADIYVGKGAISITQANITDLRLNTNLCGIVHGLIDQVDTTTLFNQYQDWIEQKKAEFNQDLINYANVKQTDFENWVDDKELGYNTYVGAKQSEWDIWYDTTTTQFQQEFMTWFNMLQDVLDENTAGNLYNMIEAIPKIYSGATEPSGITTGDYWFREVN